MLPEFERHPRAVRQLAASLVGLRNHRLRFGSEYRKWQAILAATAGLSERDRWNWQRERLLELVGRIRGTTSYYADTLPSRDSLAAARGLREALDAIPLLEKGVVRAQPERFRNTGVKQATVTSTSGSTGAPMQFGHDQCSIQRRFAFLHDHYRMVGVGPFDPSVRLSGRILCRVGTTHAKPWLFNPFENQLFLSSYHLDDEHAQAVWRKLDRFRPSLIDGYPSGILEALRMLDRRGHRLQSLRGIITTAETLQPDVREELEALSGAPVMDYYAASEGVPFIQQCPQGTYHVRWQSGIFEVRDGDRVSFSGSGELVCTSFIQDRTPLLRYCTGDLVEGLDQAGQPCPCGLHTPTVHKVLGRVEDMVYTKDGRALGMFTYRTLKLIEGLLETQVIQHGYADFEVNSVCAAGRDVSQIAEAVKASFERTLGYPITLRFNPVARIPRGANGKVRLVVSKVTRKVLEQ